ncbi:DUF4232 domain-containing protein [Actinacidiphila epipremni]|uniref:DUF4232 domain-containing protein n=1 Tax=Actinacidiphila epipremni TaxID=2053013 RepID=A0ABX0ZG47_9ACTN|nr:DUF4232 domain-containing protein [Actinacidiphila epipremni]NJP42700.1 DUF4232 domain-containing protein [Actinacidiphila epipremni]
MVGKSRGGVALAVGLTVLVAVAGCRAGVRGADGLDASVPAVPTATTTAATATAAGGTAAARGRTAPATSAPPAAPGRKGAPKTVPPGADADAARHPACTAGQLTLARGATDNSRVGRTTTTLELRNASAATCLLRGWPGVTASGHTPVQDCGTVAPALPPTPCAPRTAADERRPLPVTRTPGVAAHDVVLSPGAATSFAMVWTPCESWDSPTALHFTLPGDARALTLAPLGLSVCAVQVAPFGTAW